MRWSWKAGATRAPRHEEAVTSSQPASQRRPAGRGRDSPAAVHGLAVEPLHRKLINGITASGILDEPGLDALAEALLWPDRAEYRIPDRLDRHEMDCH